VINASTARNLAEELEETLTPHRLGVVEELEAEFEDHQHAAIDPGASGAAGQRGGLLENQPPEAAVAGDRAPGC
jgi:hypothetical protein